MYLRQSLLVSVASQLPFHYHELELLYITNPSCFSQGLLAGCFTCHTMRTHTCEIIWSTSPGLQLCVTS